MTAPDWLDSTAKRFFNKTAKALTDRLTDKNVETFAVLAMTYSLMRQEKTDTKLKKQLIDSYVRLATQFGLTPRSDKLTPHKEEEKDELGAIFSK